MNRIKNIVLFYEICLLLYISQCELNPVRYVQGIEMFNELHIGSNVHSCNIEKPSLLRSKGMRHFILTSYITKPRLVLYYNAKTFEVKGSQV